MLRSGGGGGAAAATTMEAVTRLFRPTASRATASPLARRSAAEPAASFKVVTYNILAEKWSQ